MDLSKANWRKSSRSSGDGSGDCVEVADLDIAVGVRDSKDATGPALIFSPAAFTNFLSGLKDHESAKG
ncbi:DUF397 domain-containing protein [Micromonospora sp. LOL_021]|uniref:DUF397 domain-containing protein n=1 Tax=Micromonospora sp. LOL_021 TaxID=3345417 RepID=UPI003A85F2E4